MSLPSSPATSRRVLRMHIPERASQIGMSVRAADRSLKLDGGGHGLLDTTHFDTVRFPPPAWAAGRTHARGIRAHPGTTAPRRCRCSRCRNKSSRELSVAIPC